MKVERSLLHPLPDGERPPEDVVEEVHLPGRVEEGQDEAHWTSEDVSRTIRLFLLCSSESGRSRVLLRINLFLKDHLSLFLKDFIKRKVRSLFSH